MMPLPNGDTPTPPAAREMTPLEKQQFILRKAWAAIRDDPNDESAAKVIGALDPDRDTDMAMAEPESRMVMPPMDIRAMAMRQMQPADPAQRQAALLEAYKRAKATPAEGGPDAMPSPMGVERSMGAGSMRRRVIRSLNRTR